MAPFLTDPLFYGCAAFVAALYVCDRTSVRRVGGLTFLRLGRLRLSFCLARRA